MYVCQFKLKLTNTKFFLQTFFYQEKIKTIDSEIGSTSTDNVREDAVSKVLGKDKPGRIRGLGRGATVTKLDFLKARDSHVKQLEASHADLMSKFEKLQNVVSEIAGKKVSFHTCCSQYI